MAIQFKTMAVEVKDKKSAFNQIKSDLEKCKSFVPSGCPFQDGQTFKSGFVTIVNWTRTDSANPKNDGNGKFLAITFEGTNHTLPLSCILKEVCALKSANDDEYTDIRNEGGLSDIMRGIGFDINGIETINKFLENPVKVVLTPYYGTSYGRLKKFNLINLVKAD